MWLARTAFGWALFDSSNREVARSYDSRLYHACVELRVRRTMFGNYTWPDGFKSECWEVVAITEPSSAD